MENLLRRNEETKTLINTIIVKINLLKKGGVDAQQFEIANTELITENNELRSKISIARDNLRQIEIANGKKQIPLPQLKKLDEKEKILISDTQIEVQQLKKEDCMANNETKKETKPKEITAPELRKADEKEKIIISDKKSEVQQSKLEDRKPKKETKPKGDKKSDNTDSEVIDASKLDMRVGRIVEVSRHADADSLFIEKVDVGEAKPRQIISGLVKYCTEADLQGRLGVFLLNLKPAKMRGVLSEGMIMCASAPEQGKVEPLIVPAGAKPGDRVTVEGYDGVPDDVLNAKKKIFELIKPDLKVNSDGVATYKGARWQVNGEVGTIVSMSLTDVQIS